MAQLSPSRKPKNHWRRGKSLNNMPRPTKDPAMPLKDYPGEPVTRAAGTGLTAPSPAKTATWGADRVLDAFTSGVRGPQAVDIALPDTHPDSRPR